LVVADRLDREQLCGQADTCTLPFELLLADPLQFFRVEVTLEDINDHSPRFPHQRVTFTIPETSDLGSRFPLEAARDPDIGSNSVQAYSIAPEKDYFSVSFGSRSNGDKYVELVLEKTLDREEQAEMDFSVIAVDGGSPPRSGTTQIHITVLDANDNAPVFTQDRYTGQVLENTPEGSVVLSVLAADLDAGPNGDISYQFSEGVIDSESVFEIDPKSGEIKLRKPLDFEVAQTHELSVRATDGGGLSAICKVLVEVLDVNDNAPELLVSSFSSPLPENSAPGTVVALFTVRDRDAGANGKVSCALDHQLFFSLRPAYKNYYELVTVRALDREDTAQHILTVTAADAGSPPLTSTHNVSVTIQDINDNAPRFNKEFVTIEMIESTPPGSRFALGSGRDPDIGANSLQKYELTPSPLFSLLVRESPDGTKHAELVLEKNLDREKQRNHHLILTALDGGDPVRSGTAQININVTDANDNPPVFTKEIYKVQLMENLPEGSLAFQVKATDSDEGTNAEIAYFFSDITDSARQLFSLDPRTGDVKVTGPIDYEEGKYYEATVEGKDGGGLTAHAKVHIDIADINDNAPTLSLLPVLNPIPEDSVPSTVVAVINVRDRDSGENGEVSCNMDGNLPFRLEMSSENTYKLVIASALDREAVSSYNITITARDRGRPALSSAAELVLEVSDVNDNAPVFEEAAYSAYVRENNAAGALVVRVSARDADAGANGRRFSLAGAAFPPDFCEGTLPYSYNLCVAAPARAAAEAAWPPPPLPILPAEELLAGEPCDKPSPSSSAVAGEPPTDTGAPQAVSCLFLAFLLLLLALRLRRWRRSQQQQQLLATAGAALRGVPATHFVGIDGVRAFLHSYSHDASLTADSRKSHLRFSAASCCDTLPARPPPDEPAPLLGEEEPAGDRPADPAAPPAAAVLRRRLRVSLLAAAERRWSRSRRRRSVLPPQAARSPGQWRPERQRHGQQ
ncbi:protocadherin beta-15-like, partial [Empidonax traillii]|uniref:protocadherin beta-15-like n=1 Tax=Empidonax traillii TaxID=164674 RepID=UPI000FFD3551